jgi:hypothetical protein
MMVSDDIDAIVERIEKAFAAEMQDPGPVDIQHEIQAGAAPPPQPATPRPRHSSERRH